LFHVLFVKYLFLSTYQQTGIWRTRILPSFTSITDEAVPTLTGHLVQHSGRRQDQRLAVGDPGIIVYSQSVAAAASVFARHVFAWRIVNDK